MNKKLLYVLLAINSTNLLASNQENTLADQTTQENLTFPRLAQADLSKITKPTTSNNHLGYSSEDSTWSRSSGNTDSEADKKQRRLAALKSLQSLDKNKQKNNYLARPQPKDDTSKAATTVIKWDPSSKSWAITQFNAENVPLQVTYCKKRPKIPTNAVEMDAFFTKSNKEKSEPTYFLPEPKCPSSDSDNSSLSHYLISDSDNENENRIAWYAFKDHLKKRPRDEQKNDVSSQKSQKDIPKLPMAEPDWAAFLKKWNSDKEGWRSE